MFTARSVDDNAWITSIDPLWRRREVELRELARSGRVVCPGCGQLLNFRFRPDETGLGKRRPHFSHRIKSECPLEQLSAEAMEAKALLYEWLQGKFPGDVLMDWPLEIAGWDRPADVYVKTGQGRPLAYWVFDRGLRNKWEFADMVLARTKRFAAQAVWTGNTMVFHVGGELKLTPTQRASMTGQPEGDLFLQGDRLTFLDMSTGGLILFRGLNLTHGPNLYAWRIRREGLLSAAEVDPNSGEILLQEDVEKRTADKEAMRQRAEEERLRREVAEKPRLEIPKKPPVSFIPQEPSDRAGESRPATYRISREDSGASVPPTQFVDI